LAFFCAEGSFRVGIRRTLRYADERSTSTENGVAPQFQMPRLSEVDIGHGTFVKGDRFCPRRAIHLAVIDPPLAHPKKELG
jgi:hypothetical protein